MVIPRKHVKDIWQLDEVTAERLSITTLRIAAAIRQSLHPDGLNVIQSNGAAASQSVMHLHVHLVPRKTDDRIGRIWPPESDFSEAQKDSAWETLRESCRAIGNAAKPAE